MLPSLASMREEKAPPSRRSTVALVVCQSSDAAFHFIMSAGVVYARQTCSMGAATVVSTLSLMGTSSFVVGSLQTKSKFPPSCYKDGRGQPRPTSPARKFLRYTDVVILYIVVSLVERWHEAALRTATAMVKCCPRDYVGTATGVAT